MHAYNCVHWQCLLAIGECVYLIPALPRPALTPGDPAAASILSQRMLMDLHALAGFMACTDLGASLPAALRGPGVMPTPYGVDCGQCVNALDPGYHHLSQQPV